MICHKSGIVGEDWDFQIPKKTKCLGCGALIYYLNEAGLCVLCDTREDRT